MNEEITDENDLFFIIIIYFQLVSECVRYYFKNGSNPEAYKM